MNQVYASKKKSTGVEFASNINPFQMEIMVLQKVNYVVLYFILKLNVLKKYPQHKLVLYTTLFSTQLFSLYNFVLLHNFVLYTTLFFTQLCALHNFNLYTTFFSTQLCSPSQICSLHNFVLYKTLFSAQLFLCTILFSFSLKTACIQN